MRQRPVSYARRCLESMRELSAAKVALKIETFRKSGHAALVRVLRALGAGHVRSPCARSRVCAILALTKTLGTGENVAGMLDGKVALVTGGGGGIGRATALVMVREGARVAVADFDAAAARDTV